MIVSHRHRFVYMAMPKVASQSVRRLFRPFKGDNGWEQCALFEHHQFPVPALAQLQHGHLSLGQLKPFLSSEQWQTYYKFAFVRHPLDRFLSACFFLHRDLTQADNPNIKLRLLLNRPQFLRRIHVLPQHLFIRDEGGLCADFIGRYEHLERDTHQIISHLKLNQAPSQTDLVSINTNPDRPDRFQPDRDVVEQVELLYQQDYKLFNYPLSTARL